MPFPQNDSAPTVFPFHFTVGEFTGKIFAFPPQHWPVTRHVRDDDRVPTSYVVGKFSKRSVGQGDQGFVEKTVFGKG